MSNLLIIARRELTQNFRAPLAYVFLILFVALVQLPFMLTVFASGQASLRLYFDLLPFFVVIFAALVTMRSWAEDRQANTYEMLLTFPMRDWELVLGKFLATYAFLLCGIAATFTLPLLLMANGEPDVGPMASGYLGAALLAGMWCAIGVFFSSLTRSQLMAALASFVLGILSLAMGIEVVKLLVESKAPGFGALIGSTFGTWAHFAPFTRGVIEIADVLYFVAWSAVFLYLNVLYLARGRQAVSRGVTAAGTALALGCGLFAGRLVHEASFSRLDLTEEGLYTLSEGTVNILNRAEDPVRATLYITARAEMPPDFQNLEQQVVDRLTEMRVASGRRLDVRVVHPSARNLVLQPEDQAEPEEGTAEKRRERTLERRLIEKGVQPFEVQKFEVVETSSKYVFAALGLSYQEKDEEFVQPLVPQSLGNLEYQVANTVARLVRPRAAKIALYLGPEPMEPWMAQQYQRMGRPIPDPYSQVEQLLRQQKFDVERVKLSGHEPMPADYDAFVCIGPTDFNDRQRWELNRALVSGKPVLLAVQRYTWEYPDARGGGISLEQTKIEPGVDEVLDAQGLGVSTGVLMDSSYLSLSFKTGDIRDAFGGKKVPAPMHIDVHEDGLSDDSVLTERLQSVLYLWGTSIELNQQRLGSAGLDHAVLASSGPESWEIAELKTSADLQFQGTAGDENRLPLIVKVEGQFKDAYADAERPDWPFELMQGPQGRPLPMPEDTPAEPVDARPGTLILCGSARMWADGMLTAFDNPRLLMNAIDSMTLDEDILRVRSKEPTMRRINTPSETKAFLWTLTPLLFVPLAIVALGLAIGMRRMRAREAYNTSHGR